MRKAFTLVELLVVIAIIAMLVAFVMPAIQQAREAARRTQCMEHQRNLAIGLQHYENAKRNLPGWRDFVTVVPPSAGVAAPADFQPGDEVAAQVSWVFSILPFIEHGELYNRLVSGQVAVNRNDPYMIPPIGILTCPSQAGTGDSNGRATSYVVNCGAVDDFSDTDPYPPTTDGNIANGPFLDRCKIVAGVIPTRCPCGNDRCRYNANVGKFRNAIAKLSDISSMDGTAFTMLISENVQRGFWISQEIVHFRNDRNGDTPAIRPGDWWIMGGDFADRLPQTLEEVAQLPPPGRRRWTVNTNFEFGDNNVAGHTIEGSIGFCWPRFYAEPDTSAYWLCEVAYPRAEFNVSGNAKQGFTDAYDGNEPNAGPFSYDRGAYNTERIPVWLNKFSGKEFGASWYQSARPSSRHLGAVVVSFCDSNVRTISQDIDEVVFVQLMTAGDARSDAGWRFPPGVGQNFLEGKLFNTGMFGK